MNFWSMIKKRHCFGVMSHNANHNHIKIWHLTTNMIGCNILFGTLAIFGVLILASLKLASSRRQCKITRHRNFVITRQTLEFVLLDWAKRMPLDYDYMLSPRSPPSHMLFSPCTSIYHYYFLCAHKSPFKNSLDDDLASTFIITNDDDLFIIIMFSKWDNLSKKSNDDKTRQVNYYFPTSHNQFAICQQIWIDLMESNDDTFSL